MRAYIVSIADRYGEVRQVIVRARSKSDALSKAPVENHEHIEMCIELN